MKITTVRTRVYEVELSRRLGDANRPEGASRAAHLLLEISTDEGVTGISLGGVGASPIIHQLEHLFVGTDPRAVKSIWQRLMDATFKGGNEGIVIGAISMIDVALWDLKAKIEGQPLWRTLGGDTPQVAAYASGLDLPLSDTELRSYYQSMAANGIVAGKLKVGRNHQDDFRRLGIMREALLSNADNPVLAVDYNEFTTPKQAIRRMADLEGTYDIAWCEEPARRFDYRGLRRVSEQIRAAVATGENLAHVGHYMPLLLNEAVDLVQIGHGTGGITGAMQVAEVAHAFELPVAMMSCPGEVVAHAAAAMPHHTMMEVIDAGMDAVVHTSHQISDGSIVLSSEVPGTGLIVNEDAMARLETEQISPEAAQFPWARAASAGRTLDR